MKKTFKDFWTKKSTHDLPSSALDNAEKLLASAVKDGDKEAVAKYKQRIADLKDEVEEAPDRNGGFGGSGSWKKSGMANLVAREDKNNNDWYVVDSNTGKVMDVGYDSKAEAEAGAKEMMAKSSIQKGGTKRAYELKVGDKIVHFGSGKIITVNTIGREFGELQISFSDGSSDGYDEDETFEMAKSGHDYPRSYFISDHDQIAADEKGLDDMEDEYLTEIGRHAKYKIWDEGHIEIPKDKMKYLKAQGNALADLAEKAEDAKTIEQKSTLVDKIKETQEKRQKSDLKARGVTAKSFKETWKGLKPSEYEINRPGHGTEEDNLKDEGEDVEEEAEGEGDEKKKSQGGENAEQRWTSLKRERKDALAEIDELEDKCESGAKALEVLESKKDKRMSDLDKVNAEIENVLDYLKDNG